MPFDFYVFAREDDGAKGERLDTVTARDKWNAELIARRAYPTRNVIVQSVADWQIEQWERDVAARSKPNGAFGEDLGD